jgi:S1-C subfamily serine protease
MKRILLEILGGLTVLVLLASFHQQIARLKIHHQEVSSLRALVQDAIANVSAKAEDATTMRAQIMAQIEAKLAARMQDLEQQVAQGSLQEADKLKEELEAARRDHARFKAQFAEDLHRTQKMVGAYHAELKANEDSSKAFLMKTENELALLRARVRPNHARLTEQMLLPSVQLNGDDTVGSGTLIYSRKNEKTGQVESYVLTAFHVVRNILADTPTARREGIAITIYQNGKQVEEKGDMVAHKPSIDVALLKLRSKKLYKFVAGVLNPDEAKRVQVWDPVYAVGCPLGNDPIHTKGEISSMRNELNGSNYWMINAPTYFGNSGGGVYMGVNHKLAGVFSKIYTHGRGTPTVIPHMGLFTPVPLIRKWLTAEKKAFVLGDARAAEPVFAAPATPTPR